MGTLCGANCSECSFKANCKGCEETCGRPFGGTCVAAEYIKVGGKEAFVEFKRKLMEEINSMGIEGMPEIQELYCLCGSFVNLEYPLPSGNSVKFLDDKNVYLGTQVEPVFAEPGEADRCYGIIADTNFILVCEYGCGGANPEIILYKKR